MCLNFIVLLKSLFWFRINNQNMVVRKHSVRKYFISSPQEISLIWRQVIHSSFIGFSSRINSSRFWRWSTPLISSIRFLLRLIFCSFERFSNPLISLILFPNKFNSLKFERLSIPLISSKKQKILFLLEGQAQI